MYDIAPSSDVNDIVQHIHDRHNDVNQNGRGSLLVTCLVINVAIIVETQADALNST